MQHTVVYLAADIVLASRHPQMRDKVLYATCTEITP
jgi:hypothetical protein